VHDTVALQPDVQYIAHPSEEAHIRNALVMGLRLVLTAGYPKKATCNRSDGPDGAPEGSQPADDGKSGKKSSAGKPATGSAR
jgi:hypothetical protein